MKKLIFILALICNLTFAICNCSSQWSQVSLPVTGTIQKVQFVNPNTGWSMIKESSTKFTLIRTSDGGLNWTPIFSDSTKVMRFQFIDDSIGYGMGMAYVNDLLLKTSNGGYNWTVMQSSSSYALSGFYFVNADTGYFNAFVFPGYNTYRTTNGFQSYEIVSTEVGGSPSSIFFFKEPYNGNLCGYLQGSGYLWKTTNSGYNWTQLSFSNDLINFSFVNKDTGWVVLRSSPRQILKTTNSGTNWIPQHSDPSGVLSPSNIFASDNNNIWCGLENYYYKIIRTTNSGSNWGNQTCPIPWPQVVYMYDTSLGFAWNNFNNNNLVRTTNGGGQINSIEKISESIPDVFELKQNYPNPFNPSTNIEFQISRLSTVYLEVFDMLGRNVAELVNGKDLQAGYYRYILDLNDKSLSSGVYFYRLTTYIKNGNKLFATTKKMIYNK